MKERISRLALLETLRARAIAPVSGFRVGAVALAASGREFGGTNVEFAGLPVTTAIHAEQAAVVNAWLHGETALSAIAVSATPCGMCRQFLMELGDPRLRVLVEGSLETKRGDAQLRLLVEGSLETTLGDLLPAAFGPADLGVEGALLSSAAHGLGLAAGAAADEELVIAALAAANASYAPYTHAFAGVALRTDGADPVIGRYAESAAFNASVGPLQSALAALASRGVAFDSIVAAALVEVGTPVSQRGATESLLANVAPEASMFYARAVTAP